VIRLRVAPEVSEPDFSTAVQFAGFVIPGLTQRKAETTVEIGNGQTVAIAGLLSEELRGVSRKIPGLGDIPVLGALFSSVEYRKSNTELVILVTPELAEAMTPAQVPSVPGEFMTEPNDFELFGLGLLEGHASRPGRAEPTGPTTQPAGAGAEEQAAAPAAGAGLVGRYGAADYEEAQ
jgi:pilus assembly protein CpaC